MWAGRCRPGKSPENVSPSSFSVRLIPGDMSPGKPIPSDKSPGIPRICRWENGKCCSELEEIIELPSLDGWMYPSWVVADINSFLA
ncbi:hypothetical protein Tco_1020972 [Tanacetum coccineum]